MVAFEFRHDRSSITWLRQFFLAGFKVSEPDSRAWYVSLVNPVGPLAMVEAFFGRGVHRQWRAVLRSDGLVS